MNQIGVLQENSLHAALKSWYAMPGDRLEEKVDGFVIDIVRGDMLIEIQTGSFSNLKRKLSRLVPEHPVLLVYPIAREKWIVYLEKDGLAPLKRRKSPRAGRLEHLFLELVSLPDLICQPNFSLEVVFTREEEVRLQDGRGSWRRKGWSIADRRLVEVVDRVAFEGPQDFHALLPVHLPNPFTCRDLARATGQPAYLAQKMAYCLRQMGAIDLTGKRGRAYLYAKE